MFIGFSYFVLFQVDSFIIDADELSEEAKARISSKLLLPSPEDGGERIVDPETQARLQSLLKAAGIIFNSVMLINLLIVHDFFFFLTFVLFGHISYEIVRPV